MPRKDSEPKKDGKPDFDELATQILARIERSSGKLLEYGGHQLTDDPRALFAEREELVGILALAAFNRIHVKFPFTAIARDLRAIRERPRKFVANKENYSAEARALLDRQLLRQANNNNTLAVFEISMKHIAQPKKPLATGAPPRTGPLGSIRKAAAAALSELQEAYDLHKTGKGSVDPGLLPFLELPISQSNAQFSRSLRRWLTKEGEKPTRVTQKGETRSSVDAFIEIFLDAINEIIVVHGGKPYSQESLVAEMSKAARSKKST